MRGEWRSFPFDDGHVPWRATGHHRPWQSGGRRRRPTRLPCHQVGAAVPSWDGQLSPKLRLL